MSIDTRFQQIPQEWLAEVPVDPSNEGVEAEESSVSGSLQLETPGKPPALFTPLPSSQFPDLSGDFFTKSSNTKLLEKKSENNDTVSKISLKNRISPLQTKELKKDASFQKSASLKSTTLAKTDTHTRTLLTLKPFQQATTRTAPLISSHKTPEMVYRNTQIGREASSKERPSQKDLRTHSSKQSVETKTTTRIDKHMVTPQAALSLKEQQTQPLDLKRTYQEQEEKDSHHPQDEEEEDIKIAASSPLAKKSSSTLPLVAPDEALFRYGASDSKIASFFPHHRVSQFDVLTLFFEILKLSLQSQEQEKISRRQERALQIAHMEKVVSSFKAQAKWMLLTNIGAGVLSIVSGLCPIISVVKGQWFVDKLGLLSSKIGEMKPDKFFKAASKITNSMSEMYKGTGQIQSTLSEGKRTYDQHKSDIHRADWEENTRTIEEIKEAWKGIENFLYQSLQMYHDAIRQLYGS